MVPALSHPPDYFHHRGAGTGVGYTWYSRMQPGTSPHPLCSPLSGQELALEMLMGTRNVPETHNHWHRGCLKRLLSVSVYFEP